MEWSWRHGADSDENTYVFSYDDLSRLTDTRQYMNGQSNDQHVERGMSYDLNGNILSLQRYADGVMSTNYSYTYSGNQLSTLSSGASAAPMMASSDSRTLLPPSGNLQLIIDRPLKPFDPIGPAVPPGDPIDLGKPIIPIIPGKPIRPIDPDKPLLPFDPDRPHKPILPGRPTTGEDAIPQDTVLPFISPDTLHNGAIFRYDYNGNMVYDALRNRNTLISFDLMTDITIANSAKVSISNHDMSPISDFDALYAEIGKMKCCHNDTFFGNYIKFGDVSQVEAYNVLAVCSIKISVGGLAKPTSGSCQIVFACLYNNDSLPQNPKIRVGCALPYVINL